MTQWTFVIAAYVVTLGGTATLLGWSYHAMRRAEAAAERLRERR